MDPAWFFDYEIETIKDSLALVYCCGTMMAGVGTYPG